MARKRCYIPRDSATQGHEARAFGDQGEVVVPPKVLDRWQKAGDPRLWKMIISPEFGDGLLNDFNLRAEQLRPPGGGEGGQIRRDVCLSCRRLLAEKAFVD